MPDIFDQVSIKEDVFDKVSQKTEPKGDIFDQTEYVAKPKEAPKMEQPTFMQKHPNLYAAAMTPIGTAKELSKVSWAKYIYPEEREKLSALMKEETEGGSNLATRQLLFDTMEAVTIAGWKPLTQGAKALLKTTLPKTYALIFETSIGKIGRKGTQTVAQRIATFKSKNKGEAPPKETIMGWWREAANKADFKKTLPPEPTISAPPAVLPGAAPIISKEPLPKYAQSVNLEKQNIPGQAKQLEVAMAGPKKVQSWDKTGELSNNILNDMKKTDQALKKIKGLEGLTENMEAVRQTNVNQISKLAEMAEGVKTGTITEDAFNATFNTIKEDFFKVTSEGSSEIGRALNAHKKVLSETDHMIKGLAKIEKGMTSKQITDFIDVVKSNNPAKMARFTAELKDPKLKDYVLEFWYNSILSGPPTHAVNMVSNTLWTAYQIPHRGHVALWDSLYSKLTGNERTRLFREMLPMFAGYKTGQKRGAAGAWETLKTGAIQDFETKWAQEVGLSSVGAWERSPHAWMRKVSPAISAFTRALRAEDVFMNAIAYDGEMMSIATRLGVKKGLKGDTLKSFISDFVKNPTEEAHTQSMKMAKHSTFMDDPDKFTEWFLKLRKVPVLGPASQFVVPFVNTIGNLTKRGLEFTPGIGVAKEAVARTMGRGMTTPEVIAKQIEGSMLSLYMLYKCDAGEVTGAAPQNPAERERFYAQGKQPWAVRVGNTWISYRRIEPFNTVFAGVAIAYDNLKTAKDDDSRMKIFGRMVNDLKNNLFDSSYFQGMQQVFNRHQKLEEAPQRFTASFVPYSSFWRSMNRAYEKATLGETKVRESGTWLSALAHVIPGLSGEVPAKLNIWGDEIVIPGSILQHWLPYKWSRETQDPVELELERLNAALKDSPTGRHVFPGQPTQTITYRGEKIKLPDGTYRDYLIDLGRELRTTYETVMNGGSYRSRTDEQKAKILNKRTEKARDKIRSKLLRKINEGDIK